MFTVPMYVSRLMAKKIQLGCVIDCTALDLECFEPLPEKEKKKKGVNNKNWGPSVRYFHNASEWDDFDVDYHRLVPPLSEEESSVVPHITILQKFLNICGTHWKNRPNTHICLFDSRAGMGAAAYLSAAFMCHTMRAPVHVALASLQTAWGENSEYGLCDVSLVKDLQKRYKGKREITVGKVPDWWWAVEADEEDEEDEEGSDKVKKKAGNEVVTIPPHDQMENDNTSHIDMDPPSLPASKRRKMNSSPTTETTKPQIPALVPLAPNDPKYIRALTVLKQLTPQFPHSKHLTPQLPICTSSELTSASQCKHVKRGRYKVTWRSKGRRGLLLILTEAVYFVESLNDTVQISIIQGGMYFPQPTNPQKQHRTLLDGILVLDSEPSPSSPQKTVVPRYLVTDILCHMGGILTSKHFSSRQKYVWDGVLQARKKIKYDYAKEGIKIRLKELFDLEKVKFVQKDVRRKLCHETDGLVFVPLLSVYYGDGEGSSDPKGDGVLVWGDSKGSMSQEELIQTLGSG